MDLQVSYQKLADLISWSVLSMGLANLFWMPLALAFGKRPIVLISMTMFVAGIIWTVVAKDYNSLMGARVFASFGGLHNMQGGAHSLHTDTNIGQRLWFD